MVTHLTLTRGAGVFEGAAVGITIGVDVGGTKIAAGAVDEDGNVLASRRG